MEYWDLYNGKREKINKKHLRSDVNKLNPGEYHIVVNIWIINDQNKIIITQRHPQKEFPLKWECSGGSIIAGEDSITGALREVEEEIGIKLKKENGKLIYSRKREMDFKDTYLFKENININKTNLQENEVVSIKLVTKDELLEMVKKDEIAEPIIEDINKLLEMKII
jgi:isopentenyldiphosphate isomerase